MNNGVQIVAYANDIVIIWRINEAALQCYKTLKARALPRVGSKRRQDKGFSVEYGTEARTELDYLERQH